jgi:hypothetical protein
LENATMNSRVLTQTSLRGLLRSLAWLLACAGLGAAGCGDGAEGTAGPATGHGGAAGAGGASAGAGGSLAGGAGSGGAVFIDGGAGSDGAIPAKGCEKIDFLFIVDNSASMQDNQAQLVAAFPGFISAIESTVHAGSNYHIMVVDTDEWGRCNTANPWVGHNPASDLCNDYIQQTVFTECDRTLGAGVVHPAGDFASNKPCPFPAARRYLQQDDPDISGTFSCAAQVGVAGNGKERPMDALVAALAAAINGPGGCNEGFLRDDAVLAITFISDDPNYEDSGTPQSWYDAVVQAKKGDPEAVAVVGFTPAFAECGNKAAHWAEFVAKFPFSLHAPVCSADYASVFAEAVKVIDESCDQYQPPVR